MIVLHLLFGLSGLSGLMYQVIWVRGFGHVFGNTTHSASIVVAIFMLGLGAGSYVLGRVADRVEPSHPERLVRLYAWLEAAIGGLALLVSILLPHIGPIVASLSSYERGADGWQVLSLGSYLSRGAIAVILLAPITLLMGGTLTVLVRALVRQDLQASGWRVAWLYGVNTIGAAIGAVLTDFVLVPAAGLFMTQLAAVSLNLVAAAGAYWLFRRRRQVAPQSRSGAESPRDGLDSPHLVGWTALALALSGFAALGMEILWLRHLSVLLGAFRAVFSLLLGVMLVALGAGALVGGWFHRRFRRPVLTLMVVEVLFAAAALLGLASSDADAIAAGGSAIAATLKASSPSSRMMIEIWFNLRPMLVEVALPSLVGGLAFPLANGIVHEAEERVGRRAGALYAANTAGAVCGSLVTGYLLLPWFGMQTSAGVLAGAAVLSVLPLYVLQRTREPGHRLVVAAMALTACASLAAWVLLPSDFIVRRALGTRPAGERVVRISEGTTELLTVVERPGRGRGLLTNGHAMSSTALLDQRYMRALAHIPLLAMSNPEHVLVIGFGVGNTTQAATLHASVTSVDVADLSRQILEHASDFEDANHGVLRSPKVRVFVNDGRQHLQMTPESTYDLITLEPPPIAHAGVAALYSREFYELARSRLREGGYLSQWLPAYQVPEDSSLSMVRAFLDVFPHSVLLSGTQAELLLLGTTAPRIELDPSRLALARESQPAVWGDLERLDLGSVRNIAGTFIGSSETLALATRAAPAATDDRPLQEYSVLSGLSAGLMGVPSALVDVTKAAAWCPRCFDEAGTAAPDLDLYLRLLQQAYLAPVAAPAPAAYGQRRILGSAYLGAVVPDSAEVHNLLGLAEMRGGRVDAAIREFQEAMAREPGTTNARANLGQIRYEQGATLLESKRYDEAAARLGEAVDLLPASAEAQNDLGVALASMGRVGEAAEHFRRAVRLEPGFLEAQRNLDAAERAGAR